MTKIYKKYLIHDGLVEYDNGERLLLSKKTLDNSVKSLVKKPVIITHSGKDPVGTVEDVYYDTESGNYVVLFSVNDETARELLDDKNYSISSTYEVLSYTKPDNHYHGIDYDWNVTGMRFDNIAIVDSPRYQECRICVNSTGNNRNDTLARLKYKIRKIRSNHST